jgi:hypothetical protein
VRVRGLKNIGDAALASEREKPAADAVNALTHEHEENTPQLTGVRVRGRSRGDTNPAVAAAEHGDAAR